MDQIKYIQHTSVYFVKVNTTRELDTRYQQVTLSCFGPLINTNSRLRSSNMEQLQAAQTTPQFNI